MFGIDDAIDFVEDAVDAGVDAAGDAVDAVIDAAGDAVDAIVDAAGDVIDTLADVVDAIAAAVATALEKIADVVVTIADAVASVVTDVVEAMGRFGEALAKGITDLVEAVVSVTDWILDTLGDLAEWVVNTALPFVYGLLKVAVFLAILWYTAPFWLLAAFICTQVAASYGEEYGTVLDGIAHGYARYNEMFRIRRLPAGDKYVIVSDLHRYSDGDLDIPSQQNDVRLYEGVLQHYAATGFALIENGDVEDYWLRGGSAWGVAYDLADAFTGPSADAALEGGMGGRAALHLAQVVGNPKYARLYPIIRTLFHDHGRYFRTIGNHDDVYHSTELVRVLGNVFPGITAEDFIVFDSPSNKPLGIVAHGHQTDAWNSGACSFLGRTTTSIVSAVNDVLPDSWELGVPGESSTKVWDSPDGGGNTLTEVSPLIGVTTSTDSLDEPNLHDAFRAAFGGGGPWLILGHTHAPRLNAWNEDLGIVWAQYLNDGAVLFPNMLTTIEWDGTADPENPTVRLVAWRYGSQPNTVARAEVRDGADHKLRAGDKQEFAFV